MEKNGEIITYYVGTDGTKSVGAAHVEMSAVEPQQNFDVVEAIRLGKKKHKMV